MFALSLINVRQAVVDALPKISHFSARGFMLLFWLMCGRWCSYILFTLQGSILNGG